VINLIFWNNIPYDLVLKRYKLQMSKWYDISLN